MTDVRLGRFRALMATIAEVKGNVAEPRIAVADAELKTLSWLADADTSKDGFVNISEGEAYLDAHPELIEASNNTLYAYMDHARTLRDNVQLPGPRLSIEAFAGGDLLTGDRSAGAIVKYATSKTPAGGYYHGIFEKGFRGSAGYRTRRGAEESDQGSALRQASDKTEDHGAMASVSGYMEGSMLGDEKYPDVFRLGFHVGAYGAYAVEGSTPVHTIASPDQLTTPVDSFEFGAQGGGQAKFVGRLPGLDANFFAGATVEGQVGVESLATISDEQRMTLHTNLYVNLGAQF